VVAENFHFLSCIDLGKEVRPHCVHFALDGLLYVTAKLANAIYIVDRETRRKARQGRRVVSHFSFPN
jgi:hypothetical protein